MLELGFLRLETNLSLRTSIPGYISEKEKKPIRKDTCTPMFIAELITITKIWKQPKRPSTDE